MTDFAAFVSITGIDGLSAYHKFHTNVSKTKEALTVGQEVTVKPDVNATQNVSLSSNL